MKIELELPDWVDKNLTLMILSGQELVAFKEPKRDWKIKKIRCIQCGECCLIDPNNVPFLGENEKCIYLNISGDKCACMAGEKKPFGCLIDPLKQNVPTCAIEYF